jgi:hypothetical protein
MSEKLRFPRKELLKAQNSELVSALEEIMEYYNKGTIAYDIAEETLRLVEDKNFIDYYLKDNEVVNGKTYSEEIK